MQTNLVFYNIPEFVKPVDENDDTESSLDSNDSDDDDYSSSDDDLDGVGWDLKKATLLLFKSNASFLGWLFSPIVYCDKGTTLTQMRTLAMNNFNPITGFYHYHSMNKGFYEQLES